MAMARSISSELRSDAKTRRSVVAMKDHVANAVAADTLCPSDQKRAATLHRSQSLFHTSASKNSDTVPDVGMNGASAKESRRATLQAVIDDDTSMNLKMMLGNTKKKTRKGDDIFAAFGEEHGARVLEEDFSRSQNVRRNWQSDVNMRRWKQDLADNARLDRLLIGVRCESNPEYGAELAELSQQHNGLFRQRSIVENERSDTKSDAATELRKVAVMIAPKVKAKKKKEVSVNFLAGFGFGMGLGKPTALGDLPDATPTEGAEPATEKERRLSDPNAMEAEDEEHSEDMAIPTYSEDSRDLERSWDLNPEREKPPPGQKDPAAMTCMGFFRAAPSSEPSKRPGTGGRERLPKVQVQPKTLSLLLYRNGDIHHKGEAVFIRTVPKSMKELLIKCGEGCRCSVAPAEALYDGTMRLVKEVKDLEGGGIFLLKGKEALDPPPTFFASSGQKRGVSLKSLSGFQRATSSAPTQHRPALSRSAPSLEASYSPDMSKLPVVGGLAPAVARSGRSSGRESETWGISEWLSWRLSYGGQIGTFSGRHHDYGHWPRAPALSKSRPISGAS